MFYLHMFMDDPLDIHFYPTLISITLIMETIIRLSVV